MTPTPAATSERFTRSRALLERARKSLAGGVSSPFRALAPVPLYFENGSGARLTDVDGNEYIDYLLAWGPMILGYRHPAIVAAMREAAERPVAFGAQHEAEIEVAEAIQRLVPCAERVAFTSSGSEAVQLAMRLARAFTGRPLILKFEGHYHGWMDSALISYRTLGGTPLHPEPATGSRGQVANAIENVVVAPWNRIEALETILAARGGEIAAVIMEPVQCNSGCIMPADGYLAAVRDHCTRHGVLLIFDEIITGFRISAAGAQGAFRVTPDLATFGKAAGGGAPLSVVAGRADIVEQMFAGAVFGGTFNGNPVSLACARAALRVLADGALLAEANRRGERLKTEIAALGARHELPLQVTGFGTAFALHFGNRRPLTDYRDTLDDDKETLRLLIAELLARGVQCVPDGRLYTSVAHTDADMARTLEAFDGAFAALPRQ